MKSSNAPFDVFGFSMVLRDIEDLYISVNTLGAQLAALTGIVNGISQTLYGLSGLGSMAYQNAGAVAITGGSISGITPIAVTDGGTGAATAANARTNLGLGTIATQDATDVTLTSSLTIDGPGSAAAQMFYNTFYLQDAGSGVAQLSIGGALLSGTGYSATWGNTGITYASGGLSSAVNHTQLILSGSQVVTTRQAAVTAPSGGATQDTQARTAIGDIISRLRTHGLIA